MSKEYENVELLKSHLAPLGYTSRMFKLEDEYFTQFTSPNGNIWMINNDKVHYPFSSVGARLIAKSKIWSNELVKQIGTNLPVTYKVSKATNPDVLKKILDEQATVIVKPFDSTLSRGLTTDINELNALSTAIDYALEFSDVALVQEQVYGDDIRFIVVNGSVKAVLLRQTPRVIGDGVTTVAELIKKENEVRSGIEIPFGQHYRILTEEYIPEEFLISDLIPSAGEIIELSREVLVRKGASIYNITTEIHQSYIDEIERAAAYLGKGYLAVDVFVQNYRVENDGTNYWFLEFNSSPSLALPYCVRDGNHYRVLDDLIPMIDQALTSQ